MGLAFGIGLIALLGLGSLAAFMGFLARQVWKNKEFLAGYHAARRCLMGLFLFVAGLCGAGAFLAARLLWGMLRF